MLGHHHDGAQQHLLPIAEFCSALSDDETKRRLGRAHHPGAAEGAEDGLMMTAAFIVLAVIITVAVGYLALRAIDKMLPPDDRDKP